jgi:hypothetical protein
MHYIFGILASGKPVYLARHRTYKRALQRVALWAERAPTMTAQGVLVHEASGMREAEEIAQIRIWAEGGE